MLRRYWLVLVPVALCANDAARVIERNCLTCHGSALQMSKLDLRTRDSMIAGGEKGPALVPGQPDKSRLYRAAAGLDQPSMPPGKKLADADLAALRDWITQGAPELDLKAAPVKSAAALEDRPITEDERRWWAFVPPVRRDAPVVKNAAWVRNPIDAFVLAQLERNGKQPAPPVDPRSLIRRLYLDVTGLPPSPATVGEFLRDPSPAAYEQLVDKLLASPQYGERWARHWLDLARYADSAGYEFDRDRPNAWRYRDYVVRAFNADKPYSRFILEQLAGDELPDRDYDSIVASGFLRHGPEANIKTEQTRMDELDDMLQTVGGTFFGMTMGCARCHNHKFDPIPQKDYYRMQAVFFPAKFVNTPLATADEIARDKAANQAVDDLIKPLKKQRDEIEKPVRDKLLAVKRDALPQYIKDALDTPVEKRTDGQKLTARQVERTLRVKEEEVLAAMDNQTLGRWREVTDQMAAVDATRPPKLPTALAVEEKKRDADPSYFLHHGSPGNKGSRMEPGVLTVALQSDFRFPDPPETATSSGRRLAFARWIASESNPLTARVMVNRIWQHRFGEGIVATPSNFGKTGQKPTDPELLDWMATEFIARGWSIRSLDRLVLTSNAYRQQRAPRRLEGELIRDNILAAAGTLDMTKGGEGVHPYIDPTLWQGSSGRTWPGRPDSDPSTYRRSIYVFTKRTIPVPMLEVFDKPDSIGTCARRNRSTTATQALILMNNAFVERQSRFFAQRLEREAGHDSGAQVDRAFSLVFSRPPSDAERAKAIAFIQSSSSGLIDFSLALFNTNEFAYVP